MDGVSGLMRPDYGRLETPTVRPTSIWGSADPLDGRLKARKLRTSFRILNEYRRPGRPVGPVRFSSEVHPLDPVLVVCPSRHLCRIFSTGAVSEAYLVGVVVERPFTDRTVGEDPTVLYPSLLSVPTSLPLLEEAPLPR